MLGCRRERLHLLEPAFLPAQSRRSLHGLGFYLRSRVSRLVVCFFWGAHSSDLAGLDWMTTVRFSYRGQMPVLHRNSMHMRSNQPSPTLTLILEGKQRHTQAQANARHRNTLARNHTRTRAHARARTHTHTHTCRREEDVLRLKVSVD